MSAPALARAATYSGRYAADLYKLQKSNPTLDAPRGELAKDDGLEFLVDWSDQALDLDWPADEIFGLHPTAPFSRFDHMGLIWISKGNEVVDVGCRV